MESNDLRIFKAVAYENSISKAAVKLGYVQSNITLRIQVLERELGTTLLLSNNKGVTLTGDGKKLLAYAEKITSLIAEAETAFSADSCGNYLKIGATQTISASIMPKYLSRYSEKYPDVKLTLKTDTHKKLINQLTSGELDGVFTNVSTIQDRISEEVAFYEELALISSININNDELLEKSIIVNNNIDCPYRRILEKCMFKNKKAPSKVIEMDSLEAIIRCVAEDMGISMLPKILIARNERIRIHDLPDKLNKLIIYFVKANTLNINMHLNDFIDMIHI